METKPQLALSWIEAAADDSWSRKRGTAANAADD
jgi:hypothetical protein